MGGAPYKCVKEGRWRSVECFHFLPQKSADVIAVQLHVSLISTYSPSVSAICGVAHTECTSLLYRFHCKAFLSFLCMET